MIEQKSSSDEKQALIDALGMTVVRWQDATQRFDETVGEIFGLGPAERLCLSFLYAGPQTPGAIARHVRLTPAAVTTLIDRLERRSFVKRSPDPNDRRKILVEAGEATMRVTAEAYLPLQQAGQKMLEKYSLAELRTMQAILADTLAIQEEMTARLLAKHGKG
jgi:DNA-binding MarR family transcriptional regulator